ncbi:hypothetical protein WAI453_013692 [Rhynchosporium graminicola]
MPIIGLVPVMEEQQSPQSRRHRHFSEISSSSSLTPPFKHLGLSCSPPTMSEAVAVQDPPLDLTPDEANRIIHSHRKVRYGTACWPCRQRKVKCDNKQPCENCVKRDHANLCSYNPKQNPSKSKDPPGSVAGVKRARSPASDESVKKEEDRWPRTTGKTPMISRFFGLPSKLATMFHYFDAHFMWRKISYCKALLGSPAENYEEDPNESRYLGQNSIAAFLSEEAQAGESLSDDEQDVIRKDIMPILGLQISSASYPFMSREHMDKIRLEIAAALPSDRDVLKTFQIYKQIVQPFWGLLVDIEDFESKLCIYLEDRSASSKHPANGGKGVSSAWLGMLFAVLAVANNYSEQAYHKRVAASQTFGVSTIETRIQKILGSD